MIWLVGFLVVVQAVVAVGVVAVWGRSQRDAARERARLVDLVVSRHTGDAATLRRIEHETARAEARVGDDFERRYRDDLAEHLDGVAARDDSVLEGFGG